MKKKPLIILSGGGTMGSVTPLIALYEELGKTYDFLWVGTRFGVERKFIAYNSIEYKAIFSGKARRYFSLKNIADPFFIFLGFLQSLYLVIFKNPSVIVVSGSFVSVPLVFAGWLWGVKVITHQLDIDWGLAGKLTARFSSVITCSFKESCKKIKNKTAIFIGAPVRKEFEDVDVASNATLPLVAVLGGGLGSQAINEVIINNIDQLSAKAEILHITGRGNNFLKSHKNYESAEFLLEDFPAKIARAALVVSRAGLSTIAELAVLGKPVIFIPLKSVGQEKNANYLKERDACEVLDEKNLARLPEQIINLLHNKNRLTELADNIKKVLPSHAREKLAEIIKTTSI